MSISQFLYKYSPHRLVADGDTVLAGFTSVIEVAANASATLNPPAAPTITDGKAFFSVIATGAGNLTVTGFGAKTAPCLRGFVMDGANTAWVELPQAEIIKGTLHDLGQAAAIAVKDADHGKLLHLEGGKGYSFNTADLKDGDVFYLENKAGADLTADTITFTGFTGVFELGAGGAAMADPYPVENEGFRIITITENGGNWYANVAGKSTALPEVFIRDTAPPVPAYDAFWVQPTGASPPAGPLQTIMRITPQVVAGSDPVIMNVSPQAAQGVQLYPDGTGWANVTTSAGTITPEAGSPNAGIFSIPAANWQVGAPVTITFPAGEDVWQITTVESVDIPTYQVVLIDTAMATEYAYAETGGF